MGVYCLYTVKYITVLVYNKVHTQPKMDVKKMCLYKCVLQSQYNLNDKQINIWTEWVLYTITIAQHVIKEAYSHTCTVFTFHFLYALGSYSTVKKCKK